MNEPITYPVGNETSLAPPAQDFVWAGQEGGQEHATGETATHTDVKNLIQTNHRTDRSRFILVRMERDMLVCQC